MASTNLRTVWITLRATNYTAQVFNQVMRQCEGLDAKEKKLISSSLRLGTAAMSAGMMFRVMGDQMGGVGGQMISQIGTMMQMVGVLGYLGAAYKTMIALDWSMTASNWGLDISYKELAISAAAAFAVFMIFILMGRIIGNQAAIIIAAITGITLALLALAVAQNIISLGSLTPFQLGAAAAGAGMAAGVMALSQYGGYQMGTRMIGATGPAILHKGEVVYNPSTGRPTQTQNDLNGGASTIVYEMPITIENLNTKADIDDVDEKIGKAIKRAANRGK